MSGAFLTTLLPFRVSSGPVIIHAARLNSRSDRRIFEPLRGEFALPIERLRWEQPVERACYRRHVRRNTAFQGSSATSFVLATKAGFVAIIPSKMAC